MANGMLVLFHCKANNGYSIQWWESVFRQIGESMVGADRLHWAYSSTPEGPRVIQFDSGDAGSADRIERYVREHGIDTILGFDQPVRRPTYEAIRRGGVKRFISYWGAPISAYYSGLRLLARRLEVRFARHQPDHYVFQSRAMADQAINGRGIHPRRVSVCFSGIDHHRFQPEPGSSYVYDAFGIPRDRKVIYYSGHFEERKGVAVIMRAANILAAERDDVHFVLVGNEPHEVPRFRDMLSDKALQRVTFGGYRKDSPLLMRSAYVGVLATTGWDSFPLSGLEMQASGLPLMVSNLMGLPELIEPNRTGRTFPVNDHETLAAHLRDFLDAPTMRDGFSRAARARIEGEFTRDHVVARLGSILQ